MPTVDKMVANKDKTSWISRTKVYVICCFDFSYVNSTNGKIIPYRNAADNVIKNPALYCLLDTPAGKSPLVCDPKTAAPVVIKTMAIIEYRVNLWFTSRYAKAAVNANWHAMIKADVETGSRAMP